MEKTVLKEITIDVSDLPAKLVEGVMEFIQDSIADYRTKGIDVTNQSKGYSERVGLLRRWLTAFEADALVYLKYRREELPDTAEVRHALDRFERQILRMRVYTVSENLRWDYRTWIEPGIDGLDRFIYRRPVSSIPTFAQAVDRGLVDGDFMVNGVGKKTFDLVCGENNAHN